jgi:hypothetical protein
MSGRARSWSGSVRRSLSVLVMSSLMSLSVGPLAVALGRDENHRCACCPKGTLKCCRRPGSPASGPSLRATLCLRGCGCAGAPATSPIPHFLVPARQAKVQTVAPLPSARAGAPRPPIRSTSALLPSCRPDLDLDPGWRRASFRTRGNRAKAPRRCAMKSFVLLLSSAAGRAVLDRRQDRSDTASRHGALVVWRPDFRILTRGRHRSTGTLRIVN